MESNQPSPPPSTDLPSLPPQPPTPPPPQPPAGEGKLDLNKPCRIANITFEGVHRTRPTLIGKIVADLYSSNTLLDFLQRYMTVRDKLRSLKAFKDIDMRVNEIQDDRYEVKFMVEESGRIKAAAHTAVDNHSTHLSLELTTPNITGLGDSLHLNGRFNKRIYSSELRYSVPLAPWRNSFAPTYSLAYLHYLWDSLPSGYDQEDKAIINQVDFTSLPNLNHSISFENIWRYIRSSSLKTPIEIREQCGHSVKSSIKHTVVWDNREDRTFTQEGTLAKLTNEFTTNLVNGSARFTRHELQLQGNTIILPRYDLTCQVNLLAGGPLTLRGFKFQGLGENKKGYPLGHASYLMAGVHLYSILPFTTPESTINNFVRPHVFFNTGTIGDIQDIWRMTSTEDIRRESLRFRDSLRYSCGFGLVIGSPRLRLELNYCLPLVFKPEDLVHKGFQWGFGVTYT